MLGALAQAPLGLSATPAHAGAPVAARRRACARADRREPVLRGDRDRLEQRADRRRVDVLHPRQVLERRAALGREGEEVGALLDPLAAVDLAADDAQRVGLGEQLDVRPGRAREVARARDADALGHDVRHAHRGRERLADREAADRVVARHHAPRDPDRVVDEAGPGGVERRGAALRVGVRAGEAADRQHRQAVRHLDHVARPPRRSASTCASARRRRSPPVVPSSSPAASASSLMAACAGRRSRRRTPARRPRSRRRARASRRR